MAAPVLTLRKKALGMCGFLDEVLELPLFVLLVGLSEDQGEHRQGEVVVIVVVLLAGLKRARDDRRACLALKGVAGGARVEVDLSCDGLGRRPEVLADGGERLSEVQALAIIGHEMRLRMGH